MSPSTRRRETGRKRRKSSLSEVLGRERGWRKGVGQETRLLPLAAH